jgi:hypothetical protein
MMVLRQAGIEGAAAAAEAACRLAAVACGGADASCPPCDVGDLITVSASAAGTCESEHGKKLNL